MSQLFPTIYVSFDGFQRRQLKQDLLRAFNQSILNKLGFKLKYSPRTVVDFGTPDTQQAGELCRQSALFVALLEEQAGHGSRQQMLHSELGFALPEVGTHVLLLSDAKEPDIPASLGRMSEHHDGHIVHLTDEDIATVIVAEMATALTANIPHATLEVLSADYSVCGYQLEEPIEENSANAALMAELVVPQEPVGHPSPDLANLHQHQEWALHSIRLGNETGAMASIKRSLELYDSDLMGNYWRCRLLSAIAEKDSEFTELVKRASLVITSIEHLEVDANALIAECHFYVSQGYAGLKQLEQSIQALEQALPLATNVAYLHQIALRTMQQLAQQQLSPERLDPALLRAKSAFISMLQGSLIGYQLSTQQLLMKTPKDKLDIVILGVKQDVMGSLRQLYQFEAQLRAQCVDWEIIVPAPVASELGADTMAKPIWNLVHIGQHSATMQLTLIQLLSQHLNQIDRQAHQSEVDISVIEQQQQVLGTAIRDVQFEYQEACKARKLGWLGITITAILMSIVGSGFWWLPLPHSALIGLLSGGIVAFALLAVLLTKQYGRLDAVDQRCRALDSEYALADDDLPEPRAQEGWFDRLSVRRDKLGDKCRLLQQKAKLLRSNIESKITTLATVHVSFSDITLSALGGIFNAWQPASLSTNVVCKVNNGGALTLTDSLELQLLKDSEVNAPQYILVSHDASDNISQVYFDQSPNPAHCKQLHLLQGAANNEQVFETIHVPMLNTDAPVMLQKWCVEEGDDVQAEQLIAELQSEDIVIPLLATKSGKVNRQLAPEGDDLISDQAVLELQVS
ncbi:lipoyl domain-containing protein [Echinimonas agarilytica]|uniref:Lipoyl domain-containing protein n=1 Tax=Echinimonas agarilytica TaxID=1215918 RepID=A0AA41W4S4_9GAMM|nr:lipoyl domain-containing protein [Echinimonas agarilytica]MCM2678855.1 lipoyl domain-containing protein [Echinimonas agarilytica]